MSKDGSNVKMARPAEPEVVRTTIVGGRPPAKGSIPRDVPRGLEVLIKKAAVDPAFKDILFEKRAGAAEAIGLKLTAAEQAMLVAVPLAHLEGIIAHTRVAAKSRPAFLGYAAGAMLAALGTAITVCTEVRNKTRNEPTEIDRLYEPGIGSMRKIRLPSAGILSDRPKGYREGRAVYVGGDAAGVEARRLEDIEYRLLPLFEYADEEYDALVQGEGAEPRGNILLKFTITADGKVEYAEIISNNTGFPELGARTVQQLKSKRFAPVKEGSAEVIYQIRLNYAKGPSTGVITLLPLLIKAFEESHPVNEENLSKSGEDNAAASSVIYSLGGTGIRPDTLTKRGK
jgi:hypothetical protein